MLPKHVRCYTYQVDVSGCRLIKADAGLAPPAPAVLRSNVVVWRSRGKLGLKGRAFPVPEACTRGRGVRGETRPGANRLMPERHRLCRTSHKKRLWSTYGDDLSSGRIKWIKISTQISAPDEFVPPICLWPTNPYKKQSCELSRLEA